MSRFQVFMVVVLALFLGRIAAAEDHVVLPDFALLECAPAEKYEIGDVSYRVLYDLRKFSEVGGYYGDIQVIAHDERLAPTPTSNCSTAGLPTPDGSLMVSCAFKDVLNIMAIASNLKSAVLYNLGLGSLNVAIALNCRSLDL